MKNLNALILISFFVSQIYAQNWNQIIKAVASDRGASDYFGCSVSISGGYAIIGAYNEGNSGSAYIFKKSGDEWVQEQKIFAGDRQNGDRFGYSVYISGENVLVGASEEDHDVSGSNYLEASGSAYIFKKVDGTWIEIQKIVASNRSAGYRFGSSVCICNGYALVGSSQDGYDEIGGNYLNCSGSAYIFKNDGLDNWTQVQKIVASDREVGDYFGWAVSISNNHALIGAFNEDHDIAGANILNNSGSAYVFKKDGLGNWIELQKIVASDREAGDLFGVSVSISDEYAIVGASMEDHDSAGLNFLMDAGSAYIYKKDGSGNWTQMQKLVSSDRGTLDHFGSSTAISGDYTVVGASTEDHDATGGNYSESSGSAYVFSADEFGSWTQEQKIVASDRTTTDNFGYAVSISNGWAVFGALYEDHDAEGLNFLSDAGSAYIYANNAPPTGGNSVVNTNEDTDIIFAVSDFTYSDSDEDEFAGIMVTSLVTNGYLKYDGTDVIMNQEISNINLLVFSPVLNEYGSPYATFNFKVWDGVNFSTAEYIMTINVLAVAEIPEVSLNTGGIVQEDGTYIFSDQCLFSKDADSPVFSLTYNIIEPPVYGTLSNTNALMKNGSIETASFTQNDIANGKVLYTHNGEESNEDSFRFIVSDEDGNSSEENIFTISISSTNDPPVITGVPELTINEDEQETIDVASLYEFISDPDNADSTLIITISKMCENIDITNGEGCYHLCSKANWFGTTSLKLEISDGEFSVDTTITLTVLPVNDLPVLNSLPGSVTFINDNVETLDLNGSASDIETPDSLLVFTFLVNPDSVNINWDSASKIVSLSATGNFEGRAELTIMVYDADGGNDEGTIIITVTPDPTSAEDMKEIPSEYQLLQNYPNPFNPVTVIRYSIPPSTNYQSADHVTLHVYDILGNVIATLQDGPQQPGYYERYWNAGNSSSGIYFYVLSAGNFRDVKKMLLIK